MSRRSNGGAKAKLIRSHDRRGEQRKRERNPKRLGSFEVKYQLDLDGLLDWQISRFITFEAELQGVVALARCRNGEVELFGRH